MTITLLQIASADGITADAGGTPAKDKGGEVVHVKIIKNKRCVKASLTRGEARKLRDRLIAVLDYMEDH